MRLMKSTFVKIAHLVIVLLLIAATHVSAQNISDYQKKLQTFYDDVAPLIYEHCLEQDFRAVFFAAIKNDTKYDLSLLYNDSIIKRLRKLAKSRGNLNLRVALKSEDEINKLKAGLPEKTALVEVIVNNVELDGQDFDLEFLIKISPLSDINNPYLITRHYAGQDREIKKQIIKKQYSPVVVLSVFLFAGIILAAPISLPYLKRRGWIKEGNISFFLLGILICVIAFIIFVVLTYIKHDLLSSAAFFKGAEVHFFVDTNAGLYFEPRKDTDLNFTDIGNSLIKQIFGNVSSNLYTGRSVSEKLSDSIFGLINGAAAVFGSDERVENFLELKKSDYYYKFYTFTFDDYTGKDALHSLTEGRFGELAKDFDGNLKLIRRIHRENKGQSSLIKPLMQLIKLLEQKKRDPAKMKRFIIILTDADEGYEGNIKELLRQVGHFYQKKDQYLRVFSILFPNLPKSEDKIYYYETGKLVLLSKISEMIVNLNANNSFYMEKWKKENENYYRAINMPINREMERQYEKKIEELKVFEKDRSVPSIKEIASQDILMEYIRKREKEYIDLLKLAAASGARRKSAPKYKDFFLYTYADSLYCVETGRQDMSAASAYGKRCGGLEFDENKYWGQNEDLKGDYNLTRSKFFSLTKTPELLDDLRTIADVFVDQFIFIKFDKERLAASINQWLPYLSILLGFVFAWLIYRYKYHVNYHMDWREIVTNGVIIAVILAVQLTIIGYIAQTKNNWIVYGSSALAFWVSLGFALCVYILPQSINLIILKKSSNERDALFSFAQPGWLRKVDRYLFDFLLLPIMTISMFLVMKFPILKRELKGDGVIKTLANSLFLDYNNLIDIFFTIWIIIGLFFILRAFIFSDTLDRAVKKF